MNRGGPLHFQPINLELDLVIGKDSGPDEYILYRPFDVLTDGNDRILIPDATRYAILVYSSSGTYMGSVGRKGEGPGEFISFPRLQLWRNGVLDAMVNNGRWQRWSLARELEFDRRPLDISSSMSTNRYPAASGDCSVVISDPFYGGAHRDTSSGWWVYLKEHSDEPHQVVTLLRRGGAELIRGQFEGDNLGTIAPYSAKMILRQKPAGGFIVCYPDSAQYTCYDERFNQYQVVQWDQPLEPLSKDEVVEGFSIYNPAPAWGKDQLIRWVKSLSWPDTKPVISDVLVGIDNRIWLELWDNEPWARRPVQFRERDTFRYLVFLPSGEMELVVELPFKLRAASRDYLFELVRDGESTPQVKRYRWWIGETL
ncbi:6-bladed beta-propeller [Gemmatimonadota bacterium]